MRITYVSDLHVDILKDPTLNLPNEDQYDLCIVAGDIANHARECIRYMNKFKKKLINNKPLIYVPGNHCRWSLSFAKSELILSKFPDFMNRSIRVIDGQRFLGLTLWYGLREEDSRKTWSDFRAIEDWRTIQQEHDLDLEFLNKNLQEGDIVVSHMLPSSECVSGEYIGYTNNRFYISDVDSSNQRKKT